ncbi:MAG TPA: penicillin-binding protein 2, partial [Planctomycetota bacterium]|nr:penicillin-binding protein 2 [Planctomycetota bacterium]
MSSNLRLNLLAVVIAVGFLVLLSRLCYIQASSAEPIREDFLQHQTAFTTIPAWRGPINDAQNRALASSLPVRTVSVYLREFNPDNAHDAALQLSPLINVPVDSLEQKLSSGRSGQIVLAHDVDFDNAQMAALLRIPGIKFDQEFKRIYPGGSLACHLLGRISRDEKSAEGLEFSWNDCLRGTPGKRSWPTTGRRQMLGADGVETVDPTPGDTLTLTIDLGIQNILEEELANTVLKFAPKAASAVVLDPNTGDVLAAANYPNFDPNDFSDSIPDARRNRLITDIYEPGSTFKSFILSLAIDQGAVTPATKFDCEKGVWIVGKRHLHDAEPMGILSVADILAHSSNIGAAKTALRWGNVTESDLLNSREPASRARIMNLATKMRTGLNGFGFGDKTGIDLMGEVPGLFHEPKDWTRDSVMSVAMGHEIGVTAMQLANAYCTVVNGGHLLKPHVILRRTKADGSVGYERQVEVRGSPISEATSNTMRMLLRGVVDHGTGAGCEYPGLLMGGKTGTAQKLNP